MQCVVLWPWDCFMPNDIWVLSAECRVPRMGGCSHTHQWNLLTPGVLGGPHNGCFLPNCWECPQDAGDQESKSEPAQRKVTCIVFRDSEKSAIRLQNLHVHVCHFSKGKFRHWQQDQKCLVQSLSRCQQIRMLNPHPIFVAHLLSGVYMGAN